jgi:hypothetical protein
MNALELKKRFLIDNESKVTVHTLSHRRMPAIFLKWPS